MQRAFDFKPRPLVLLESPYAANSRATVIEHVVYAHRAMLHSISLGEAPMASHLLYTQILDDLKPADRALGIELGLAWRVRAERTVVYTDYGVSNGMRYGIAVAERHGIPIEYREIGL